MHLYSKITPLPTAFNQASLLRHLRDYLPENCSQTLSDANELLTYHLKNQKIKGIPTPISFNAAKDAIAAMLDGHQTHAQEILGKPHFPPHIYLAAIGLALEHDFNELLYTFQANENIKDGALLMAEMPVLETILVVNAPTGKTPIISPNTLEPSIGKNTKTLFMLEQRRTLTIAAQQAKQSPSTFAENGATYEARQALSMTKTVTQYIWPQSELLKQNKMKANFIVHTSKHPPKRQLALPAQRQA